MYVNKRMKESFGSEMNKYLLHIIISILFVNRCTIKTYSKNLPRYDFKKINFGFTLGINSLDFNIKYNPEVMYKIVYTFYIQIIRKDLI